MTPPNNRGRAITKVNALTYAQLVKYLLEEATTRAQSTAKPADPTASGA